MPLKVTFDDPSDADSLVPLFQDPSKQIPMARPSIIPAAVGPQRLPIIAGGMMPSLNASTPPATSSVQPTVMPMVSPASDDSSVEPIHKPSLLGHVGHVLGDIGKDVAIDVGTTFVPGVMPFIHGTPQHAAWEEIGAERKEKAEADVAEKQALAEAEPDKAAAATESADAAKTRAAAEQEKADAEKMKAEHPQATEAVLDKQARDAWLAKPENTGKTTADWPAYKESIKNQHLDPKWIQGPDGKPVPVNFNPSTGKYSDINGKDVNVSNATPFEKPSTEKPVAGTVNGKPTWGVWDAQKGWTSAETKEPIAGFTPPPNYAEIAPGLVNQHQVTQTKTLFGPDGKPHDYSWNPENQRFDIDQGFSTSGQAGSREAQANVLQTAGENVIKDIEDNKKNLGTLTAWYKSHTLDIPYAGDPKIAGLDAELRSFAALNPAMHGFRSTNALDTFEKIIGGVAKNPDATIASIRGILKTAGTMGTTGGASGTQMGEKRPTFAEWNAGRNK